MTYKEIQDAVLLDRFNENQRSAVKFAINSRYGRVWALEPWSFKRALVPFTVPTGDGEFTLTEVGLQKVESIWSDLPRDYTRLLSDRPESFLDWANNTNGTSSSFSLLGDTVRLDRPPTSSTDLLLVGEKKWVKLTADTDVPLLPEEYHFALVQGAAADMLLREADPTWQAEEKMFTDQVNEMRMSYMSNQRMTRTAYPSWPY